MLSLPFDFRGRLCKGREGKRKGREGKGIEIMIVIHRIQFAAAAGLALKVKVYRNVLWS